jgi:ribonuclease-3
VPDYQVEESGPDHQKSFRATVRVGGQVLGAGQGRTKKAAEQQAAETAWRAITAESEGLAPKNGRSEGLAPKNGRENGDLRDDKGEPER